MSAPFLDQLVDWRKFEDFVRELYAHDENLVAERDVTEVGSSGAPRQIDVKLTQIVDGAPQVTLAECKRWKSKVDRQRLDVLAASVEDLGADRGVMFTTSGYEAGAEAYAKHKGIEIFVVRDLLDQEWGAPGRVVWFYLHFYGGELRNVEFGQIPLLAIVEEPPKNLGLTLFVGKDESHDPAHTLYSIRDGSPGPNLVSLVIEARARALELLSRSIGTWDAEAEGETKAFLIPLRLDLSGQPYRQLLRSYGGIRLETLTMELLATITQSRFETDRGASLDLALAVENYVTKQRRVVTRREPSENLLIYRAEDAGREPVDLDDPELLQNGSVLKAILEAWVETPKVTRAARTASVAFRLPDWDVTVTPATSPDT